MAEAPRSRRSARTTEHSLTDLRTVFPLQRKGGVLARNQAFSMTRHAADIGPATVIDLSFGADIWIECAEERPYYQVNIPVSGQVEHVHRNNTFTALPGTSAVVLPHGALRVPWWGAGGRTVALRIKRYVVEDALAAELGREVTSQIPFSGSFSTARGAGRSWMQMVLMLNYELQQPDSALRQPMIADPYLDALVRNLLLATDHPYRGMLAAETNDRLPQTMRTAIEIIEAEAHLPLTVSALASRCEVSARNLQQAFQRHMAVSPMAYLRQVRLRRAHRDLLYADPPAETVASVASRWGFTNPGRFAAAHADRYGESPATTLRKPPPRPTARRPS